MSTFAGMTEGGTFTPAPEGTHGARLLQAIDLGTQDGIYGPKRNLMVTFELPSKPMEDGRPYTVTAWYTASLNRKGNLRGDLTSWLGRELTVKEIQNFSWKIFSNTPCLVTITHKTKDSGETRAKVQSITAVPEGMDVAPLVGELLIFDLENFDEAVFAKIPEGIKAIIEKSPQHQALTIKKTPPTSSLDSDPLSAI